MKRLVMTLIFILVFVYQALAASLPDGAGWYSWEKACRLLQKVGGEGSDCSTDNPPIVTEKSFVWVYLWGGDLTDFYYDDDGQLTRVRIRITWVSDKSPYNCGQLIEKRYSEIKEFTHRSILTRECK